MCGRYHLSRQGREVAEGFATEEEVERSPRYNIVPSDQIPTVLQDASNPVRHLALIHWGNDSVLDTVGEFAGFPIQRTNKVGPH